MTQARQVLLHINDFGSITSIEAIQKYGITRLAARISDLRNGKLDNVRYNIKTTQATGVNRFQKKVSFARYTLEKQAELPFRREFKHDFI